MAKGSGGGARSRQRRREARFLSPFFARRLAMAAAGPARHTPEMKQSRFLAKAAKEARDA
jgi:hypothetical protein